MLPILNIGPLAIQVPGLLLLISLWLGLSLSEREATDRNITPNQLYNLVFITLIVGVVGARLMYVARYPEAFFSSPLSLISLNPGLLDPMGGFASGFITGLIYIQRKDLNLWNLLDSLTPALAVMVIGFCLASFASGSTFGKVTNLPWGIDYLGAVRHPVQLYGSLGGIILLFLFWPNKNYSLMRKPGDRFFLFLAMASGFQLFYEAFREDSALLPGGFRIAQIVAWLVLGVSLWLIFRYPSAQTNPD